MARPPRKAGTRARRPARPGAAAGSTAATRPRKSRTTPRSSAGCRLLRAGLLRPPPRRPRGRRPSTAPPPAPLDLTSFRIGGSSDGGGDVRLLYQSLGLSGPTTSPYPSPTLTGRSTRPSAPPAPPPLSRTPTPLRGAHRSAARLPRSRPCPQQLIPGRPCRSNIFRIAMPRRNVEVGVVDEAAAAAVRLAKIRKRCALSSSGASNPARKLRSRRSAVLLQRRRGGGGGASPPPYSGGAAMSESSRSRHCRGGHLADEMRSSASARRLVNAFWQMDKDKLFGEEVVKDAAERRSLVPRRRASTESKRSRGRSKILEADGKGSWHNGHGQWFSADMKSIGSAMEIGTCSQDDVSRCPEEKAIHLQGLYNSLVTSKELVEVLAHIWGLGELNPSTVSLISALRSELDLTHAHVRRLIKEQKSEGDEIEGLKEQLVEEMESWKSKQKEKVANALQFIVSEMDSEKKSRKRAERTNKKLGMALANTKASLHAATKELERERKSKGRVEKICSELIRGIGEDKAEVEALKRETEKAQEELQKEQEMLQLADEWREQRVQMKLLEARFQFEEKNAAISQLLDELQAYLDTKKEQEPANDQMQSSHASENGAATVGTIADKNNGECSDEGQNEDSEGSDMHSIELNVDGNSKSHTWSYTRSSKGKQRTSSRHDVSFSDRGMDGTNSGGFNRKFQEMDEELEGDWAEGCSDGMLNLDDDEERYQVIKNLREQMFAGSGFILSQGRENAERGYCGL